MKNNRGLILFLMLFGSIFMISGLASFIYNYSLLSKGTLVEGNVIKMVYRSSTRRSSPTYEPLISYKAANGKEYQFQSNFYSEDSLAYKKGDKITVCYDPKNPESATLADEDEYLLPLIFGGGLGALMCWGGIRVYRKDKKKQLSQNPSA